MLQCRHPVTVITKNALIERDLDLLAALARENLVYAFVSITSLDNKLSAKLEPRASAPHRRIAALKALSDAGVPCGVMVAPIIPMVTDRWLERILESAAQAGARAAGYTVVRLPYELKDLFREWLSLHVPERATHVMSLIQQMRGGRDNDAQFGSRMRGQGEFAELIRQRFRLAARKHGINQTRAVQLDTTRFRVPEAASPQGQLFG
jgi:DNA repair photolyase